ncbi:MAG: PaaI family thioesterase [Butyrivibrio sp.]|nr:PaaI family thioesterase [Butyrivibrio sp.]
MSELDEARNEFSKDLFATKLSGIVIEETGDDFAKCSMKITENHRNAYGGVMGGAIYTLADFTFAVASNFQKQKLTASLVGQATFLSMTHGKELFGEARLIKDGRQNCFYEVRVYDDLGKDIAIVSFTGAHVDRFVTG